jgi:hypothetical protein
MIGSISDNYLQSEPTSGATYASSLTAQNQTAKTQNSNKMSSDLSQSTQVTLSEEALRKLGLSKDPKASEKNEKSSNKGEFTPQELRRIEELKTRDREVRAHEMAHVMVGGTLVRKGASYQYELGPDGVRYAVAGEVSIDSSAVDGDPSATIRKMEQVKRAAQAPANPSSQDRAVAAAASQAETAARHELNQQTTTTS